MIPQHYFEKMKLYFNGDAAKTWKWFKTTNPALGGVSPLFMIKSGKVEKLKKFIDNATKGIYP